MPPAPIPAIKGVLFDKDGTLIDFHATWPPILRRAALVAAGGDEGRSAELLRIGGMEPESGAVRAGSALGAGNTRDIVAAWFPDADASRREELERRIDAIFLEGGTAWSVPVAGLLEVLADLSERGLRLGVATSDATGAAEAALTALGVARYFDAVIGYDAVARPKPAADMAWAFCRAARLDPAEIAVVGDNRHDLHMARAAGAGAAIGVLTGNSRREDLAGEADAVLQSIADLPAWLDGRAG